MKTILVVEDEKTIRDELKELFYTKLKSKSIDFSKIGAI